MYCCYYVRKAKAAGTAEQSKYKKQHHARKKLKVKKKRFIKNKQKNQLTDE